MDCRHRKNYNVSVVSKLLRIWRVTYAQDRSCREERSLSISRSAVKSCAATAAILVLLFLLTMGPCPLIRGCHHRRWRPNDAELHAWGRLQLIGEVGFAHGSDKWPQLLTLLGKRELAPVGSGWWYPGPRELVRPRPPRGATTPSVPPPPPELEWTDGRDYQSLEVSGGPVAAVVYGKLDLSFAPCFLAIAYRTGNEVEIVYQKLIDRFYPTHSGLIVCRGGDGLVIYVMGLLPTDERELSNFGKCIDAVYIATAPNWQPRRLLYLDNREPFNIRGATPDGQYVFLVGSAKYVTTQQLHTLWRIDTDREAVEVIGRSTALHNCGVIPSPDGTYLATTYQVPKWGPSQHHPLRVVDCLDGSVYIVTWRDPNDGYYIDTALAWSAEVPGRLYFLEVISGRIWQLDLDIEQVPPETPPRGMQITPAIGRP